MDMIPALSSLQQSYFNLTAETRAKNEISDSLDNRNVTLESKRSDLALKIRPQKLQLVEKQKECEEISLELQAARQMNQYLKEERLLVEEELEDLEKKIEDEQNLCMSSSESLISVCDDSFHEKERENIKLFNDLEKEMSDLEIELGELETEKMIAEDYLSMLSQLNSMKVSVSMMEEKELSVKRQFEEVEAKLQCSKTDCEYLSQRFRIFEELLNQRYQLELKERELKETLANEVKEGDQLEKNLFRANVEVRKVNCEIEEKILAREKERGEEGKEFDESAYGRSGMHFSLQGNAKKKKKKGSNTGLMSYYGAALSSSLLGSSTSSLPPPLSFTSSFSSSSSPSSSSSSHPPSFSSYPTSSSSSFHPFLPFQSSPDQNPNRNDWGEPSTFPKRMVQREDDDDEKRSAFRVVPLHTLQTHCDSSPPAKRLVPKEGGDGKKGKGHYSQLFD